MQTLRRVRWVGVRALLALFLFSGCASKGATAPAEAPASPEPALPGAERAMAEEAAPLDEASGADGLARQAELGLPAPPPPPPQSASVPELDSAPRSPRLIYSATLTVAVFKVREAMDQVEAIARKRSGYLLERNDTSITVRVPSAAFEDALEGLSGLGDEIHREIRAEDVTQEYADLETRLANAEAVRRRLEELLARASDAKQALAVERELERVTESIELIKGRLRLLSELVRFSTITVVFQPRQVDQVGSEVRLPFSWLRDLGLPQLLDLGGS